MNIQKCPLTEKEKRKMVAESAFLRSNNRERPGDMVADWLAAEEEINAFLEESCPQSMAMASSTTFSRMRKDARRILHNAENTANKVGQRWYQFGTIQNERLKQWKRQGARALNHATRTMTDRINYFRGKWNG